MENAANNIAERSRMKVPERAKKKSYADDMFAAYVSVFVLSSYAYENYMPAGFMEVWRLFIFIIACLAWIIPSFKSGCAKRISFPVFTLASQALTLLVIFLSNSGPRVFKMSISLYALSELFSFICYGPIHMFTENYDEYPVYISSIAIILVCALSYIMGIIFAKLSKRKGNYIPKRC